MADTLSNNSSLLRSTSTSSAISALRRSWSRRRANRALSNRTSSVSSSPSPNIYITTSQPSSPTESSELARHAQGPPAGDHLSPWVAGDGSRSLATILSDDDRILAHNRDPGSLTRTSVVLREGIFVPPTTEERRTNGSILSIPTVGHDSHKRASTDALSLAETLTCPNSLEREMNVTAEDHGELAKALELLSLDPPPIPSPSPSPSPSLQPPRTRLNRGPTLRSRTIGRLRFSDTTKRSLDALVTNSFTPAQLSTARGIRSFIDSHPDTPLPQSLITKEIAEIYGEHGWCLIGKCGLKRVAYKIAHLMALNDVTDEELERDSSRKRVDLLCGHIRDRHFEQMLFRCRLCPASYINQDELSRHWRTHAVNEFACPTCGEILVSDLSIRVHRHSNKSKGTITAKLLRLLVRAVPRK